MTGQPPLRDPGAQAERTLLSWTRTCVALVLVGALLLRLTVVQAPQALLTAPALVAAAVAFHVAARRRYRTLSAGSDEPAGPLLAALTAVAVAVAALCGASVLV